MKNGNYITNKQFLCYTHVDDWTETIQLCAENIIENSILLLEPAEPPPSDGIWEDFLAGTENTTINGKISVKNDHDTDTLWVNTSSLLIDTYNITDRISGNIHVKSDGNISISNITSTLTVWDISAPVNLMTDTRIANDDINVNQFSNYGILIDGSLNPIQFSKLEFNRLDRFDKRDGNFFNYLQPEMHHSNTPADGINMYSFSISPEIHQPTGNANFSKIENIILNLWIGYPFTRSIRPNVGLINADDIVFIFAPCYNVLRVSDGLAGISYNG